MEKKTVYNPWRDRLENHFSGESLLSGQDKEDLIKELDAWYAEAAERKASKPIGYLRVEFFRGDPGMVNTYLDYYGDLPEGGHTVYVSSKEEFDPCQFCGAPSICEEIGHCERGMPK